MPRKPRAEVAGGVHHVFARGIDRLCVTDHDTIRAALQLKDRFPDRVIVGEVRGESDQRKRLCVVEVQRGLGE
jgi:predicted metal-dependent phosphoesterase TrpH